jgi:hypothetical protein
VRLTPRRATGVILWPSRDDARRRATGTTAANTISPSGAGAYRLQRLRFGCVRHVDERILADGYAYNEVNTDDRQRSLRPSKRAVTSRSTGGVAGSRHG